MRQTNWELYSPYTPPLGPDDHLASWSADAPFRGFYWVKLREYLLCTVWVLTHLQNKKWFPNLILSWPILSLVPITFSFFSVSFFPSFFFFLLSLMMWHHLHTRCQCAPAFCLLSPPFVFAMSWTTHTGVIYRGRLQSKQVIIGAGVNLSSQMEQHINTCYITCVKLTLPG